MLHVPGFLGSLVSWISMLVHAGPINSKQIINFLGTSYILSEKVIVSNEKIIISKEIIDAVQHM